MENIVAYRIRNARKLRAMSLQEVADNVGVSKQMISKYEKGINMPPSDKLIKMSKLFELKVDYFFNPFKIELNDVNFRKRASFGKKKQKALAERIKIYLENYIYIEDILSIDYNFKNPVEDLLINDEKDIINAVIILKEKWQIGFDPVHNIIQLLEDKRIKIIELDDLDSKFDGLATYVDDKFPVIVLNKGFEVERKRFSIVHELAHLLLKFSDKVKDDSEKLCNKFASEFLISDEALLKELGGKRKHIALSELKAMQGKYGISIKAIIYKMKEIGILNNHQLATFYKNIRRNKSLERKVDKSRFKSNESSSRYEYLVYRALSQGNISLSKAASLLNIETDKVKEGFDLI